MRNTQRKAKAEPIPVEPEGEGEATGIIEAPYPGGRPEPACTVFDERRFGALLPEVAKHGKVLWHNGLTHQIAVEGDPTQLDPWFTPFLDA